MIGDVGRRAEGKKGSTCFEKTAQLRDRLCDRQTTEPVAILHWNFFGSRCRIERVLNWSTGVPRRDAASHEYQHVELTGQISRIQSFRIDHSEWKVKLLQQKTHPT